jgi:hypothetical protein
MDHADHERADALDGAYGLVSSPGGFHVLSLLCFLAALGARFITALLPGDLVRELFRFRSTATAFLVPAFAVLGLLCGLVALRKPETRATAKIALGLNAVVLLLSALALWAFFRILPE